MQGTTIAPTGGPARTMRRGRRSVAESVGDFVRANVQSFAVTGRVLWALMLRDFRAQYGHRRLGLFWAFLPQFYLVVFFIVIFSMIREKSGLLGHEVGPFITLGLMNLQFFQGVTKAVSSAPQSGKSLLIFPRVKVMDLYFARYLLQLVVLTVVFTTFMFFFVATGQIPLPDDLANVLAPLAVASVIGFSMGLIDTVLSRIVAGWDLVWRAFTRLTFMTSGLFFVTDGLPLPVQEVLYYQPILHLTEWVRSGYYAGYESRFYDPAYPIGLSVILLTLGLVMERVFRNRVLNDKKKR